MKRNSVCVEDAGIRAPGNTHHRPQTRKAISVTSYSRDSAATKLAAIAYVRRCANVWWPKTPAK